jgi:hypothetical protein
MYLLSYFTADSEALHLAVSLDGTQFTALNGGRPVIESQVGAKLLRDPFIGVGPDGLFHLLATDGWTSPHFVHATSPDLWHWSEQRLLPGMAGVPGACNAWAPEFFRDRCSGLYHLIWSSVVEPGEEMSGRDWQGTGQDQRIWHTTTTDFLTFGDPAVFFDPGYPVLDATVQPMGDRYVMAFKDERGFNDIVTPHKNILLTSFERPGGPFTAPTGPVSPSPVEGPSLFERDGEWTLIFDHFLEGRYGAVSTRDFNTWAPADIDLPAGTRHASVTHLEGRSE